MNIWDQKIHHSAPQETKDISDQKILQKELQETKAISDQKIPHSALQETKAIFKINDPNDNSIKLISLLTPLLKSFPKIIP